MSKNTLAPQRLTTATQEAQHLLFQLRLFFVKTQACILEVPKLVVQKSEGKNKTI